MSATSIYDDVLDGLDPEIQERIRAIVRRLENRIINLTGELEEARLVEFVYLGIVVPPPDVPPRPERVAHVFADEEKAMEWRLEGPPPTSNSSYRKIEKHEVVR